MTTKKRGHAIAALIPTPSGNIAQSIFAKLATHHYEQGHSGAEAIAFAEEQVVRLYPRNGFKPQYAPQSSDAPRRTTLTPSPRSGNGLWMRRDAMNERRPALRQLPASASKTATLLVSELIEVPGERFIAPLHDHFTRNRALNHQRARWG